jgi:hypothetical protein
MDVEPSAKVVVSVLPVALWLVTEVATGRSEAAVDFWEGPVVLRVRPSSERVLEPRKSDCPPMLRL